MKKEIPIEISARHIHISQKDLEALFGEGYQLKKESQLTQPSDFAAEEKVTIETGEKKIDKVRIVGPPREETQVELSLTDTISLGVDPEVRISGNIEGTSGVTLIGPEGKVELKKGLIVPQRHIHCNSKQADEFDLKDGSLISVKVEGKRAVTFHNIKVRVGEDYNLCLHLDTDEGNACGIKKTGKGEII